MKVPQYKMIEGEAPLTASWDGLCAPFTIVREMKEHFWLNTGMCKGPGSAHRNHTFDIHMLAHDLAAHDKVPEPCGDGQYAEK